PRVVFLAVALVMVPACSSSSPTAATKTNGTVGAVPARPAGKNPSASAKMVCAKEAQDALVSSLGATPVQVTTPTWVDHVYACQYVYSTGTFALSVKELDSAKQTTAYYDGFAARFGRRPGRLAVGQGAYVTTDGSVVVRKDWKVLYVDVSHLPPQFGQPPQAASDAALSVAATILSCWSGA
ncbi:MAG TPA: hypothetical protein VIJ44_04955, partial [Acidimicrobiia bacterium]